MGDSVWLRSRAVLRKGFGDLMGGGSGGVPLRSNMSTSEVVAGMGVRSSLSGDVLLGDGAAVGGERLRMVRAGGRAGGRTGALLTAGAARAAAIVAVRLDAEGLVVCGGRLGSLIRSGDVRLLAGPSRAAR